MQKCSKRLISSATDGTAKLGFQSGAESDELRGIQLVTMIDSDNGPFLGDSNCRQQVADELLL